jgi:septal ring factor EnvC (AmiA/AmiB activator)
VRSLVLFAIAGATAAVVAMACVSTALAASTGTLQARVDQARSQAQSLAAAVQLRTAELGAATAHATAAAQRQQALEGALARGRVRLAQLRFQAGVTHRRVLVAQSRYRRSQRLLARRIIAIYKSGSPDMATVLLESDGFADLLTRTAYLKRINQADSAFVARVESLRDFVRAVLDRLRTLRGQAAGEVAQMAAARAEIVRIRVAAEARAAALQQARAAQQSALAALHSRIGGWTAQIQALQTAGGPGGNAGQTIQRWLGNFSIPTSVVMCESGGNYRAVNPKSGAGGAYQMLPSTYKGLGGKFAAPQAAPKWEQDQLASKLWAGGQGAGNWACAK